MRRPAGYKSRRLQNGDVRLIGSQTLSGRALAPNRLSYRLANTMQMCPATLVAPARAQRQRLMRLLPALSTPLARRANQIRLIRRHPRRPDRTRSAGKSCAALRAGRFHRVPCADLIWPIFDLPARRLDGSRATSCTRHARVRQRQSATRCPQGPHDSWRSL